MIQKLIYNSLLQNIFFKRSEVEKTLFVSCAFSCLLSFSRIVYTGQLQFIFLTWNLFLAFVPYLITKHLSNEKWLKSKAFYLFFFTWLFFVPNAFYIITDLFHLGISDDMPLWYDLALLLSFAWNGLLLGILSVRAMEKIVQLKFGLKEEWKFVLPVMFLNAFGIYIGRYLRFNSWDVITQPFSLLKETFQLMMHPFTYRFDWSMVICFSILMTIFYTSIKRLSKVLS